MKRVQVLGSCPACHGRLHVARLECSACGTGVDGRFNLSPFDRLTPAQQDFLLLFLRSRGNIRDVERELSLSYPTVRARLDAVLAALGLVAREAAPQTLSEDIGRDGRLEILRAVHRGELTADEAVRRLAGEERPDGDGE